MDRNNFLTILKTITETLKCPSCQNQFDLAEIQFISQADQICYVHMNCKKCKTPVWVNFIASEKKPEYKINSNLDDDLFDLGEISTDEIINFSQFIKNFDGNFKKAFLR